ncbi:MAG: BrnT family toxin [Acidobacteria bacterium]|nr:BrnT family toxin [Acidobacteriota bacterium]
MKFEWDEAKRQTNIAKHGIDFVDLPPLFDGLTVLEVDDRFNYGETRFLTLGMLNGIVFLVVHTETDEVIRIISARKASKYEEEYYFQQIAN